MKTDHACLITDRCEIPGCPKQAARKKRAEEQTGFWSPLVLKSDQNGERYYLDEKPLHSGSAIELQAFAIRSDDYGEYTVPQSTGLIIGYETQRIVERTGVRLVATLHTSLSGHEFVAELKTWMRFRWPTKPRRKR